MLRLLLQLLALCVQLQLLGVQLRQSRNIAGFSHPLGSNPLLGEAREDVKRIGELSARHGRNRNA